MIDNLIWTEKYRPKTLDDLILPSRIIDKLKSGPYQNFLFYGAPGAGKTSAAKVLAMGVSSKFINCSSETGVDNVRNSITDFCSTASVFAEEGTHKVVILDEIEGVSEAYFKALRGTIEQFHSTTRFIATTNNFAKIPEAIQSRFECISFDFDREESEEMEKRCYRRVYDIMKSEGMSATKEGLVELVKRNFPDLRRVVSTLQGLKQQGITKLTEDDVSKYRGTYTEVFDHILAGPDTVSNYKLIVGSYSNQIDEIILALGRDFLEHIESSKPELTKKLGEILWEVNLHSYQSRFALDPLVTLLSLMHRIQIIIAK
jgi:DNA polymerase III delta prime subunit